MKEKPILLLAETGFIIRNLLLGYFAGSIARKKKLIVAVKNPNDKNLQEIIKGQNVELIYFPRDEKIPLGFVERAISWNNLIFGVQMAKKSNLSLKIQNKLFDNNNSIKKKLPEKIAVFFGKIINLVGLSNWVESAYLKKCIQQKPITKQWIDILKKHSPQIVVSSMLTHCTRYQHSNDLPVIVAAQGLGIKTCSLIQSWDNLSSKTSLLPRFVDRYFTWSHSMSDELFQYNELITKGQVEVTGSPQYDFHLDESLIEPRELYLAKFKQIDPTKPYVLIGTGTSRWMPDEMDKVIQLSESIRKKIPKMQIIIRLHPKDHGVRWEKYQYIFQKPGIHLQKTCPEMKMDEGGFVPPKDFYRDQINTIRHSACVINSSSSLSVDAAILDIPIICIAYDLKKDTLFPEGRSLSYTKSVHYQKVVYTGGVWLVYSEKETVKAVESYYQFPYQHKEERKQIVGLVTDQIEQKAGLRLSKEIEKLYH